MRAEQVEANNSVGIDVRMDGDRTRGLGERNEEYFGGFCSDIDIGSALDE